MNLTLAIIIVLTVLVILLIITDWKYIAIAGLFIILLDMNKNHTYTGGKDKPKLLTFSMDTRHKLRKDIEVDPRALELFEKGTVQKVSHLFDDAAFAPSFSRILDENAPVSEYKRRRYELKKILHWGQLKLMLTEIEFLTLVMEQYKAGGSDLPIHMVYAGAAPGHHIDYLSKMFPDVHFDLYDPNKFKIKENSKISITEDFFTDDTAKHWAEESKDKYLIFCTDIRTEPATDSEVKKNMAMQRKWWETMNPNLSMFKFRLPWAPGQTEYPQGRIYIQPYAGQTSTETRLIVEKSAPIISYDNKKYEGQCYHHNSVNRVMYYENELGDLDIGTDGIDNCYDCTSFIFIVKKYLEVMRGSSDEAAIRALVRDIQSQIMFGVHDIYSQTVKSFNENEERIFKSMWEKCGKNKCKTCHIEDLTKYDE